MKARFLVLVPLLIMLLVSFSGCAQSPADTMTAEEKYEQSLVDSCTNECKIMKATAVNFENGPCLLDPMPQNKSWVCDIAHEPRESADGLAENQCQAFRNQLATHFIEVTPDCVFLRKK